MIQSRGERDLLDLEAVFKALSHASRRHVLVILHARGGAMTAGEIAKRFSCSWPTTSRHLRNLEEAGLVRVDRHGREWVYSLQTARLNDILGGWLGRFAASVGDSA